MVAALVKQNMFPIRVITDNIQASLSPTKHESKASKHEMKLDSI
jgi:hypothetical protein